MKVSITSAEAMEKGIWPEVKRMFGIDEKDEIWPNEEFILTEEQAAQLGLLPKPK